VLEYTGAVDKRKTARHKGFSSRWTGISMSLFSPHQETRRAFAPPLPSSVGNEVEAYFVSTKFVGPLAVRVLKVRKRLGKGVGQVKVLTVVFDVGVEEVTHPGPQLPHLLSASAPRPSHVFDSDCRHTKHKVCSDITPRRGAYSGAVYVAWC